MRVLITGGAGFMGSNFTRFFLEKEPDAEVWVLDVLTYAGSLENIQDCLERIKFVQGDICNFELLDDILLRGFDAVFHFAAESHVDRSIISSPPFVKTNILGTHELLAASLKRKVGLFVYISTDEIYGSIRKGFFREESPFCPSSPYSASKASGDLLAQAFFKTHKLPIIVIRPSNNYGPYQYPEKLIPLVITNAIENLPIPVYGKGLQRRDWLYVKDCCEGIYEIFKEGELGECYNMGGENVKRNIDVVREVLMIMRKPKSLIKFIEDRPAHDFRYALSNEKIREKIGWYPKTSFKEGLLETINWYRKNEVWWRKRKYSEAFQEHRKEFYKNAF